jgi:hypothetical protein
MLSHRITDRYENHTSRENDTKNGHEEVDGRHEDDIDFGRTIVPDDNEENYVEDDWGSG